MSTAKKTTNKSPAKASATKVAQTKLAASAPKAAVGKPRRDSLNLRIQPAERSLIDRAAASAGKTRTDFILDAARKAAESQLLDRAVLLVGPEAYAEFLKRLDAPAQPNELLRRTMQAAPPWARVP